MTSLFFIVRRSLRQHLLSTVITVIAAGLASGLVMSVFNVSEQSRSAFTGGDIGYDGVLGAKGSPLQHVLNTVYHMESSPGNISYAMYQEMKETRGVKYAIPYAVGDNLYGYRIVGTTREIFDVFEYQTGKRFEFAKGGAFDEMSRSAVFGATVASKLGLGVGDTFSPYHGFTFNPSQLHEEVYTVSGVLEPTNTPSDLVIWIPLEGIYRMEGHFLPDGTDGKDIGAVQIPDELKEVSAVMVKFHSPGVGMLLAPEINRGEEATFAWPIADVMLSFLGKLAWITDILRYVAYLVVVVAGFGLLASVYNTMNERRREFAVLRALGAAKRTVFSAIVLEAATIAFLGSLLGYALYAALMVISAAIIKQQTGVVLETLTYHPALLWTPVGMVLVGAVAGVFPALKAYSTDVARTLA